MRSLLEQGISLNLGNRSRFDRARLGFMVPAVAAAEERQLDAKLSLTGGCTVPGSTGSCAGIRNVRENPTVLPRITRLPHLRDQWRLSRTPTATFT